MLGFIAPVSFLAWESAKRLADDAPISSQLLGALQNPLTLAAGVTLLYAEAARGTYEDGAVAALLIVLAGILPVVLLMRHQIRR